MAGESVKSYAGMGHLVWVQDTDGHGRECACLVCADLREWLGVQPLDGMLRPERIELTDEGRAAS